MEELVLKAIKEGYATIVNIRSYLFYNYEIDTPVKNVVKAIDNLLRAKMIKEKINNNNIKVLVAIRKRKKA